MYYSQKIKFELYFWLIQTHYNYFEFNSLTSKICVVVYFKKYSLFISLCGIVLNIAAINIVEHMIYYIDILYSVESTWAVIIIFILINELIQYFFFYRNKCRSERFFCDYISG